jgi:hypothetical protein
VQEARFERVSIFVAAPGETPLVTALMLQSNEPIVARGSAEPSAEVAILRRTGHGKPALPDSA